MECYEVSNALPYSTQPYPSPLYSIPPHSTIVHICFKEARFEGRAYCITDLIGWIAHSREGEEGRGEGSQHTCNAWTHLIISPNHRED